MRPRRGELVVALLACLSAGVAHARLSFPSVTERALGVGGTDVAHAHGSASRSYAEVADAELFGIAGLRATGVRAGVRAGPFPVGVAAMQIAAPVGAQTRVSADAGYEAGGWSAAVRVGIERLALDAGASDAAIVAGVASRVTLGPVTSIAEVESIGAGETREIWIRFATVARAGRVADIVTSARVTAPGSMALGVGMRAALHPALALLAGYDDGTETLSAGVAIAVRRWELSAGVFRHAVLGLSQSVSLAWSR